MNLITAQKILELTNRFINVVNTTTSVLNATYKINEENRLTISIAKKKDCEIADMLFTSFTTFFIQNEDFAYTYDNEIFTASKTLNINEDKSKQELLNFIKRLTKALYLAIDTVKVECTFPIEIDDKEDIPNEIYWQLDEWNQGWIDDGEEDKCFMGDLISYKLHKNFLYSISLGYYNINSELIESDLVPELIGVLFESLEDFCYVISYQDDYIHFYTTKELNDDNIYDIEEGLIRYTPLIAIDNQEETVEDFWDDIGGFKMDKTDLKEKFEIAKEKGLDIAVELTVPTKETSEIIIVKNNNLDYKLNYYLQNYNDELELERFTEIKILSVSIIRWNMLALRPKE